MNLERRALSLHGQNAPATGRPIPLRSGANAKADTAEETLAVVVITRNEAAHIADCLQALCDATRLITVAGFVVVDSDSDDATPAIAATYPVEVYRYRAPARSAAAGRAVGTSLVRARYILFVDGDSFIEPDFPAKAVELMETHPDVGIVYGQRREIYEDVKDGFRTHVPDTPGLGGTALYRSEALAAAGGFDPYLTSDEEGELRARVERGGYAVHEMGDLMFTHHTVPKDTLRGYAHRIRRSMFSGCGQVLRRALQQGSFRHHARRLNRPLIAAAYLLAGAVSILAAIAGAPPALPLAWAAAGALAFLLLWYRRKDFGAAVYIVCDWTLSAIGLMSGFIAGVPERGNFEPVVERLRPPDGRDRSPHWEYVPWPP